MAVSESELQAKWVIHGQVQGVGFRPFVYRLARRHGLTGEVWNQRDGVHLLLQGYRDQLADFRAGLLATAPTAAHIDRIEERSTAPSGQWTEFRIRPSRDTAFGQPCTRIPADLALCDACRAEMLDPDNRRYRYPFINCTHCGPRFTLIGALPYDRSQTSMASFTLCPACRSEYDHPEDRRFHAQPNACARCGPQLRFLTAQGEPVAGDPLKSAAAQLQQGAILAIKGIGGYQLVCDATRPDVVQRLRTRKHRPHKPFAVMAPNLPSLRQWVNLREQEAALLTGPISPIVLVTSKSDWPEVAPGMDRLGVMLPYSPLHELLFFETAGRPPADQWGQQVFPHLWVVTSGNVSGAPIFIDDAAAMAGLSGIADGFLIHNREILERCDDSVWLGGEQPRVVRSARGMAPQNTTLPLALPPVVAVGAGLKSTVCVASGENAVLSAHIGDLSQLDSCEAFDHTVSHLLASLALHPEWIISDLHPELYSTQFAEAYARSHDIPHLRVQHHHAHVGAVLAEQGRNPKDDTPYLGIALDGIGLGEDGLPWGGELFVLSDHRITRLGHLRPLPLPGGDAAAREPWRMAVAALSTMPGGEAYLPRFAHHAGYPVIRQMLAGQVQTPFSTSAGRWFDVFAGWLTGCEYSTFEGQAAMTLEALARCAGDGQLAGWPEGFTLCDGVLDFLPALAQCVEHAVSEPAKAEAAWRWHGTFVLGLTRWIDWAIQQTGIRSVVVSGGCLLNQIVYDGLRQAYPAENGGDVQLLMAERIPCNDGGISLGQLWIAAYLGLFYSS